MSDAAGPGIAASVYTDYLDRMKGLHGADVASTASMGYNALYRYAPRIVSWMPERRLLNLLATHCMVPVQDKVRLGGFYGFKTLTTRPPCSCIV